MIPGYPLLRFHCNLDLMMSTQCRLLLPTAYCNCSDFQHQLGHLYLSIVTIAFEVHLKQLIEDDFSYLRSVAISKVDCFEYPARSLFILFLISAALSSTMATGMYQFIPILRLLLLHPHYNRCTRSSKSYFDACWHNIMLPQHTSRIS